jgi:hypothetical protein
MRHDILSMLRVSRYCLRIETAISRRYKATGSRIQHTTRRKTKASLFALLKTTIPLNLNQVKCHEPITPSTRREEDRPDAAGLTEAVTLPRIQRLCFDVDDWKMSLTTRKQRGGSEYCYTLANPSIFDYCQIRTSWLALSELILKYSSCGS